MINKNNIHIFGQYFTPSYIVKKYILPEIKDKLYNYIWIDLFAGSGNLIFPILDIIPENERIDFFKKHIFLFDIQDKLVDKMITIAENYGIPKDIAQKNITKRDSIKDYPVFLLELDLPLFHITNPPYLYIGYISKHPELYYYSEYFKEENQGYQDLYQLALINDLRNNIKNMIYIIPSNFLFGFSVSNKIRNDFLKFYNITKTIVFEKEIFEYTKINSMICFFQRKETKKDTFNNMFNLIKIAKDDKETSEICQICTKKKYKLTTEFDDFVDNYSAKKPINVNYYLYESEIVNNFGNKEVLLLDVNNYKKVKMQVIESLFNKLTYNVLFLKTIDSGKMNMNDKAGLYLIRDYYGVDGIMVTKSAARTHPIQLFFNPELSIDNQLLLKDYFNLLLNYFRDISDSKFLTNFKQSNYSYIRKYLGLRQAKKLIQTFPILSLNQNEIDIITNLVQEKEIEKLIDFVKKVNSK